MPTDSQAHQSPATPTDKALWSLIDWAIANDIPEEKLPRNTQELASLVALNLSFRKLTD